MRLIPDISYPLSHNIYITCLLLIILLCLTCGKKVIWKFYQILVKHQKDWKYYDHDCQQNFILFFYVFIKRASKLNFIRIILLLYKDLHVCIFYLFFYKTSFFAFLCFFLSILFWMQCYLCRLFILYNICVIVVYISVLLFCSPRSF